MLAIRVHCACAHPMGSSASSIQTTPKLPKLLKYSRSIAKFGGSEVPNPKNIQDLDSVSV